MLTNTLHPLAANPHNALGFVVVKPQFKSIRPVPLTNVYDFIS